MGRSHDISIRVIGQGLFKEVKYYEFYASKVGGVGAHTHAGLYKGG